MQIDDGRSTAPGWSAIRRRSIPQPQRPSSVTQVHTPTPQDIKGQTQDCLDQLDAVLKEAGTSSAHLVRMEIWLKDIGQDFVAMNEVYDAWSAKRCFAPLLRVNVCIDPRCGCPVALVSLQHELVSSRGWRGKLC